MKLTVVCPVYPPEPVVSARISADIVAGARSRGDEVVVITAFPNRPAGRLYAGYSRAMYRQERGLTGELVIRCFSTLSKKSTLSSRFLENLSFGLTSALAIIGAKRSDIVFANSWPIFATGLLCLAASIRRVPVVIMVQDIYPESLISQQRSRVRPIIGLLSKIDGVISRFARQLIVISGTFADIYRTSRGIEDNRIQIIPNWGSSDLIDLSVDGNAYRRAKGISDGAFLCVYGGNVGAAAGIETVVEAVGLLNQPDHTCFLIAGEGSHLAACQTLAAGLAPGTVLFHHPWANNETSVVLRAADLLVLPTSGDQSLASMPSKLISYMLSGRPVLALAREGSELARVMARSECGWVLTPDCPEALSKRILELAGMPEERERRGQAGRAYALEHFTRERCVPRVLELLDRSVSAG